MGVLLALLIANLLSIITFYILKRKKIYSNKGLAIVLPGNMLKVAMVINPIGILILKLMKLNQNYKWPEML